MGLGVLDAPDLAQPAPRPRPPSSPEETFRPSDRLRLVLERRFHRRKPQRVHDLLRGLSDQVPARNDYDFLQNSLPLATTGWV